MLQSGEADQQRPIADETLVDLGIDSLNAVDIRSWFSKELKVDLPILRILGGSTVGDVVKFAVEKLPDDLFTGPIPESLPVSKRQPESDVILQQPSDEPVDSELDDYDQVDSSDMMSVIDTPGSDGNTTASDLLLKSVSSTSLSSPNSDSNPEADLDQYIDRMNFERTQPMSFGQSRFWFLKEYLQDQTTFNITCSITLRGKLRIEDFENAVKSIGQRHEALRTAFFTDHTQQPMQGVLPEGTLRLERKLISTEIDIEQEVSMMKEHIYDLSQGKTMRILLLSQKQDGTKRQDRHQILIGYHHINMDGISLQVILSELERVYKHERLSTSPLQYPDYASRKALEYRNGKWAEDIAFWKKEYQDLPPTFPLLDLSEVKLRRPLLRYDHHKKDVRVGATLAMRIRSVCKNLKVTPYHFYLAAFEALLLRFSNIADVCIGVTDGNRNESDTMQAVGFFLNLLPLRLRPRSEKTFTDAVKGARNQAYSAMAHSRLPFDLLLNELKVPRAATNNPLFQVLLDYRQGVQEKQSWGECQLEGQQYEVGRTSYDIAVDITDNARGEALLMLATQKDLYTEQHTNVLLQCYLNLIDAFAKNPSSRFDEPALYRDEEVDRAVAVGRGPLVPAQWPATLSHRIDEMAATFGHRPALMDGSGGTITYEQMTRRVNSIALGLMNASISAGSRVGVFQRPSNDWICSALAILRIGAVYVPLDLRLSLPRLKAVVGDCQPHAILADSETMEHVSELAVPTLTWTINVSLLQTSDKAGLVSNVAKADAMATILYTSGSTGVPKGVSLSHEGLRNNIEGNTEEFQVTESDVVLQQIALSFDFSLWQICMGLANGAALYVVPESIRRDAEAIVKLIKDQGITFTGATPSEYISWLRYGGEQLLRHSKWTKAVSSGEEMTETMLREFRSVDKHDLRLFNGYGPTEGSVSCTKKEINYLQTEQLEKPGRRVAAGYTAPNYAIYIVDDALMPLPLGIPGQILIGGAGVAQGYFNNDSLTSQRFMEDSFAHPEFVKHGWTRVHLTGDRGRLRDDGALIVEGRIDGDTQIKLRGLRIDLQDIEATIVQSSDGALYEAVVSLRSVGDINTEFLVAFVLFAPNFSGDRDAFLRALVAKLPLPQYMRPAMMISIDKLPTSNHFKLDRKALNAIDLPRSSRLQLESLDADLDETESRLIRIWEQVISHEIFSHHKVSKSTDFFHVGGSSIRLAQLRVEVRKVFGTSIPLVQLFQASTLEEMALQIQSSRKQSRASVTTDWDAETNLPLELADSTRITTARTPKPKRKVIVLTGATGFLGKAILQHLVNDKNIARIHCVAVRGGTSRHLITSDKVTIHEGDLSLRNCGLSDTDAARIFREADAIIHNGADVSFLKTYKTLKQINVASTLELARLNLAHGGLPFHYVSTTAVGTISGEAALSEQSLQAYKPSMHGVPTDGYVSSKWVSEVLLEKLAHCFPVVIHRPSSITGDGAPALDVMHNLLKFSRQIKAVPVSKSWTGQLDFVSVENTARNISNEIANPASGKSRASTGIRYRHHAGDVQIPIGEMKSHMEKMELSSRGPQRYRALSLSTWADEAGDNGLDSVLATYLKHVEEEKVKIVFPRVERSC